MIKNLNKDVKNILSRRSTKHIGELLEHFVLGYSKSKNLNEKTNYQHLIILVSFEIARRFSHTEFGIEKTDDFYLDVALTFFEKVTKNSFHTSCLFTVRNICRDKSVKSSLDFKNSSYLDAEVFQDMDAQIIFKESLQTELNELPEKYKAAVLYFITNPENIGMLYKLYNEAEQFVIYSKIGKIMGKISNPEELDVPTHTSQMSHMLLLSGLFKLNPKMLVLLTASKSLESIFKICELFGGQEFTIPTKEELHEVITVAANLASKLDLEKKLSIRDRELFLHLVSEISLNEGVLEITGTPVIQEYLKIVITRITEKYAEYQDKILNRLDFSKVTDVSKLYGLLNTEFDKQLHFISELNNAMANFQEMTDFLTLIQNKSFEILENSKKAEEVSA